MEKALAMFAILWILSTIYFTFKAIRGDYPIYFGIVTATLSTGLGAVLGYLVIVVAK